MSDVTNYGLYGGLVTVVIIGIIVLGWLDPSTHSEDLAVPLVEKTTRSLEPPPTRSQVTPGDGRCLVRIPFFVSFPDGTAAPNARIFCLSASGDEEVRIGTTDGRGYWAGTFPCGVPLTVLTRLEGFGKSEKVMVRTDGAPIRVVLQLE